MCKIDELRQAIYKIGDNCNAELLAKELNLSEKEVKRVLSICKYRKYPSVTYDKGFINIKVIRDKNKKRLEEQAKGQAIYEWKQKEYMKLYLDGIALVQNNAMRTTDRVKQNKLNFKILSRIDDIVVLELLKDKGVETD